MAYTTPTLVRSILDPLYTTPEVPGKSDTSGKSASLLPDANLLIQIERAEAEVNTRLGWLYVTPFTPVPDLIEGITTDIAAWFASLSYRQSTNLEERDPVEIRYRTSWRLMMEIASGKVLLPGVSLVETYATESDVGIYNVTEGRLFLAEDFDLSEGYHPRRRP